MGQAKEFDGDVEILNGKLTIAGNDITDNPDDNTLGGGSPDKKKLGNQKNIQAFVIANTNYTYWGFADKSDGTGFTLTDDGIKPYSALKQSNTPITPILSTFAGLWVKRRGSSWFFGTSDPISVPPAGAIIGDNYMKVPTGEIWQNDGTTWISQGTLP